MGIILILLFTISISLFVTLLDFVIIEYEGSLSESFKYTFLALKGNKLKLLGITFVLCLTAISFIFLGMKQMHSLFVTPSEIQKIEAFVAYSTFVISQMGLILYLGYYQALKNNRIRNKFETLN